MRELIKTLFGLAIKLVPQAFPPEPAAPAAPTDEEPAEEAAAATGPSPRPDQKLSSHFGLWELTKTDNATLQGQNRTLTDEQVQKLAEVAALMEKVRDIVGLPISVHSGYRCPELNAATIGSATRSQHMLAEACDWSVIGQENEAGIEAAFSKVWDAAKAGQIAFGQLIVERAQRSYGTALWVHISLGRPYRDPARCGEVMRMTAGPDGKPVYNLLERLV